jgi:hypothetical protein
MSRDESRLQTAKMRFLRAVKVSTRQDHLKSEDYRRDFGVESIKPINYRGKSRRS